ncbi:mitogen-activated protein kinase kinase kinase nsy-1-like isoform X3 [Tubulanus polymorphus]|uniref:mitogen-activated protein kinase kinase kinase nsy-1-like isoform X3 n=1 Tax=Tubulanus polymorphus TaxID=672921 RepID=UPI003DA5716B
MNRNTKFASIKNINMQSTSHLLDVDCPLGNSCIHVRPVEDGNSDNSPTLRPTTLSLYHQTTDISALEAHGRDDEEDENLPLDQLPEKFCVQNVDHHRNIPAYLRYIEDGGDSGVALFPAMTVNRQTTIQQPVPYLPGLVFYSDQPADDFLELLMEIKKRQISCHDINDATRQMGVISSEWKTQILIQDGNHLEGVQFATTRVLDSGSYGQVRELQDYNSDEQRCSRLPYCQKDVPLQNFYPDEVRLFFGLAHKNLVQICGVVLDCSTVHVLMECVQGTNLINHMKMLPKRPCSRYSGLGQYYVILFAKQLVSVLAYLEHNQIIHNDIEGSNILISPNREQVKLADFRLAETSPAEPKLRVPYDYLAPEKFTIAPYNTKVDVFSLGLTLIKAVFGYPRPYYYFYRNHPDAQMNACTIRNHCESGMNLSVSVFLMLLNLGCVLRNFTM